MKGKKYFLICLVLPSFAVAQTVNEGILTVFPDTEVSSLSPFYNEEDGTVWNDGDFYFYSHFKNEGLYTFDEKLKSSYAIFESQEGSGNVQELTGSIPSEFYDVLFNNTGGIALGTDMSINGTANFTDGIVEIDSVAGAMLFLSGSETINASDKSFANGTAIEKRGNNAFTYPIGTEGMYRMARISAPKSSKDTFFGRYHLKNTDSKYPHRDRTGIIKQVNNQEYWTIERDDNTKSDIMLTLSWDARTTPSDLLKDIERELRIVRWDVDKNLWVDEGGVVNIADKTVTTPTTLDGYGVFTLARVDSGQVLDGGVVVYNGVTPNGDGDNDHLIIDKIERYPNNTVEIYNRWGVKVYSTTGYNNQDNNFTGISDGRATVNKDEKLPTGTYYYILEYEYKDDNGSRMIKKAGYLHLENQ